MASDEEREHEELLDFDEGDGDGDYDHNDDQDVQGYADEGHGPPDQLMAQQEQQGTDDAPDLAALADDEDDYQDANIANTPLQDVAANGKQAEQPAAGGKLIDLTKASNRLQQRLGGQQNNQRPAVKTEHQQLQPAAVMKTGHQQQPAAPARAGRAVGKGRGIKRYFMLKSVNQVNWDTAQEYKSWATQPQNEQIFDQALSDGYTVVFFLSVNQSGQIQGYGRMTSQSGQGPAHVPWQDIKEEISNFNVSWDCTVPLGFSHDSIKGMVNPFPDRRYPNRNNGQGTPLNRHRDGQELAPPIGERLLAAMNTNAAKAGKPATGPLANFAAPGIAAGTAAARSTIQQQRMMQLQQQGPPGIMARVGQGISPGMGMPGRPGVGVAGAGASASMPGRGLGPGLRPGGVHPPPPPPGRPGAQQPPHALARFAGRLEGLPPGPQHMQQQQYGRQQQLPYQQQQQQWPQPHSRGGSPPRHSRNIEGYYRRSRSRSRSPVRGSRDDRHKNGSKADDEQDSENMTYEEYLATYDKVHQRLLQVGKHTSTVTNQKPHQEQHQQQLQLIDVDQQHLPMQQLQQRHPRPTSAAAGGGYGGVGEGVGSFMNGGGAVGMVSDSMQQRGRAAAAVGIGLPAASGGGGGSRMQGMAGGNPAAGGIQRIPTLEE